MDDRIKFIFLPDGEIGILVVQYGQEKFEEYIEQAQSLHGILIRAFRSTVRFSTQEGRGKVVALAAPLIRQIPGDMLRLSLRNMFQHQNSEYLINHSLKAYSKSNRQS